MMPSLNKEELRREMFKIYDMDGDDKLSKEELKEAFQYLDACPYGSYFPAGKALNIISDDANREQASEKLAKEVLIKCRLKEHDKICLVELMKALQDLESKSVKSFNYKPVNPGNHKTVNPWNLKTVKVSWNKEQLKEVFRRRDVNGDGRLSKKEIEQAFKDLGSKTSSYRAWRALSRADVNKNGYISIDDEEFDNLVDYALQQGYVAP